MSEPRSASAKTAEVPVTRIAAPPSITSSQAHAAIELTMRSVLAALLLLVACRTSKPGTRDDAAPSSRVVRPSDDMVPVPAGWFISGCYDVPATQTRYDTEACAAMNPPRNLWLSSFAIDRLEVTRGEYDACVAAHACIPVSAKSWRATPAWPAAVPYDDALMYCAWLDKRLPTEAEWEKAARGTDGRAYPWGNEAPECRDPLSEGPRNHDPDCERQRYYYNPVGAAPRDKSPYGALDMAGNAAEWTSDFQSARRGTGITRFDEREQGTFRFFDAATVDPKGPAEREERGPAELLTEWPKHVVRGGFADASIAGRKWTTGELLSSEPLDEPWVWIGGIRCVRDVPGPQPPADAKPHALYEVSVVKTKSGYAVRSRPLE